MKNDMITTIRKYWTIPTDTDAADGFDRALRMALHRIKQEDAQTAKSPMRQHDMYRLALTGAVVLALVLVVIMTPITMQLIQHRQERRVADKMLESYYQYHPWVDEIAAFSFSIDYYGELSDYFMSPSEETEYALREVACRYVLSSEYHELAETGFYEDYMYQVPDSQRAYFESQVMHYEAQKLIDYLF